MEGDDNCYDIKHGLPKKKKKKTCLLVPKSQNVPCRNLSADRRS